MKILGLNFNRFDIFILLIALIAIISFISKGIMNQNVYYFVYALMTVLFTSMYVKLSQYEDND